MSSFASMQGLLELLVHWLSSLVKSRRRLEAENLVLRHQVSILRRRSSGRLRLSNADRMAFIWLYRLCPSVVDAIAIIRPETVIHWHRRGFRALWRWKSRSRGGRPAIPREIRDLIQEMSRANGLWGAPRIHGELLKLGHRGRSVHCCQVHDQAPRTTGSELDDLPAQPCSGDRRRGPVRRADDRLQAALLPGISQTWPKGARSPRRNGGSNGRVGCAADDRGLSVGHGAKTPGARSRCRLWPRHEATPAWAGYPGSTDGAAIALAKRLCIAFDRFDTARVS